MDAGGPGITLDEALLDQKRKPVDLALREADIEIRGPGPVKRIPYSDIIWFGATQNDATLDYVSDPSKANPKHVTLNFHIAREEHIPQVEDFAVQFRARAYGQSKQMKRAYVLVNPHSGPGGATKKWEKEVRPMFDAARMTVQSVVLTRGGEAADLVEQLDIDSYDIVIACSGDGTVHEVFNGLARRPNARTALGRIAVGHIPCGSGNAMALNLYGTNRAIPAALGIIKGVVMPFDLVSITQGTKRFFSFLSQSLGIIAESDLATEHLRWMGARRFEVGLMMRVYQKKVYPCDLAVRIEMSDKADIKAHYHRWVTDQAGNDAALASVGEGLPELKYGTVQDDLSGQEGWQSLNSDKLGNFYCGNMAYMSPDANFFPAALPTDGYMDLVTIDGDLPTKTAVSTLLAVETGKFFDKPQVSYRKISAYRITPRSQGDGYISIDGEKVPFEPFQAEIHHGLGRVISKNGRFEAKGPIGWEEADPNKPTENGLD